MKTSIEFINHASVIIKGENISLLSDPWYQGDAFHKGWNLLFETTEEETINIINKITHIWISHEHPDHFSIIFFKKYANLINEKKVKILFQNTKDKRVVKFLKSLSIDYMELENNISLKLDEKFSIKCFKNGFYDSALLVTNENEKILNLNDCDVNIRNKADTLFILTGQIDVLLTQFSYAAWKGGVANKTWRVQAAIEKLDAIDYQISLFSPKTLIPFASFIYFSNIENYYLNDAINTPIDILERFKKCQSEIVIMKPKDIFGGVNQNFSNEIAIDFWNQLYCASSSKKINEYKIIDYSELKESFYNYCKRISEKNNMKFIVIIKIISLKTFFSPIIVKILDLDIILKFDYISKNIYKTSEPPMICLNSESLNFLFNNSFGFDTLTVNGCFEEGRAGGFVAAAKSLAIENLNNLGIFVKPSVLFNFSLISLFIKRLYRVSKKINFKK